MHIFQLALRTRWRNAVPATVAMVLLTISGCGQYPAAQPDNWRLITSLRTAISARNTEWLEANADQVARRHAAGQMNDEERAAFEAILQQARDGDWQGAETATVAFQRAQRRPE